MAKTAGDFTHTNITIIHMELCVRRYWPVLITGVIHRPNCGSFNIQPLHRRFVWPPYAKPVPGAAVANKKQITSYFLPKDKKRLYKYLLLRSHFRVFFLIPVLQHMIWPRILINSGSCA